MALVADRLDLKSDFYAVFPSGFLPATLTSNSPLRLSRRGVGVGKRLDAAKTAQNEMPGLLKRISNDPTNLEVQTICMDYALKELLSNVDEDARRKIHREIYDDGGRPENTLMVYGIIFRDAVFKELGIKR